jgi:transposase
VRAVGLDVHRDFFEVAIAEDGAIRSAGRIPTRVESLELFAQSLAVGDVVAPEATTSSDKIVSLLQAGGVRAVVANTRKLSSIIGANAKTDRLDARALARLLVSGLLDEVWTPVCGVRGRLACATGRIGMPTSGQAAPNRPSVLGQTI